jgi:hypothetical protein
VRLTDLRLAKDIRPADLRRELRLVLPGLPLPLTTEGVAKWKWKTLKNLKDLRELADLNTERARKEKWYEQEKVRVMVVSYAAAALLLLVDLDKRRLEEATHNVLEGHVEELFELIRGLVDKLDRSTDELLRLLAGRKGTSGGHPPDPYIRHYTALSLYRMGHSAKEIAWRVGTLSPEQRDSMKKSSSGRKDNKVKVPKNWKPNLRALIKRGVKIEKERFPRAAEVFARKDEEHIRATAIEAYRQYLEEENWEEAGHYVSSVGIGDDLLSSGISINQRDEVCRAFIQLGSCEENGIDPLPISDVKLLS